MTAVTASRRVSLREVAHVRAGEKGDLVNLAIVAFRDEHYPLLVEQVTPASLATVFGPITHGAIDVFAADGARALNVVLHGALDGGRSRNIVFDESGKALSTLAYHLLVDVPAGVKLGPPSDPPIGTTEGIAARRAIHGRGVRIGCATGWSRDRFEPAGILISDGDLDYLCFEAMSEVTMSAAQVARARDPAAVAYDPYLLERLVPIMAQARARGVRIVSNQGWLDPRGAADALAAALTEAGLKGVKIAAVLDGGDLAPRVVAGLRLGTEPGIRGDDEADRARENSAVGVTFWSDADGNVDPDDVVSAEVYLGAMPIVEALRAGADVVLTTRVTDASLFLAPLIHEMSWASDDWDALAQGVTLGHLLECGAQVSGGYFADPPYKVVDGLAEVGFPLAEVWPDGHAVLTKPAGTGGLVSPATCAEQLLYEVGDPGAYLNPDVSVDLTDVTFTQVGNDEVAIHGFKGAPPPVDLKALIGVHEGYLAEQFVLYAGSGAMDRARLARDILVQRFTRSGIDLTHVRFDFIGVNAVHREATPEGHPDPYEVVLRIAMRSSRMDQVRLVQREVDPMAATGPAGTGKWAPMADTARPVIGLRPASIARDVVQPAVELVTS